MREDNVNFHLRIWECEDFFLILWTCLQKHTFLIAQFLRRTATSNEIQSKPYIPLKLCFRRRLHHRYIGAVAGLSENMAGLRFSCIYKLVHSAACCIKRNGKDSNIYKQGFIKKIILCQPNQTIFAEYIS